MLMHDAIADQDIADAYLYLLGRALVLRQQRLDFEEGFRWNQLVHRAPGASRTPAGLDVRLSEAWIAIDDRTPVLLDIPRLDGRYVTWQMLNGWGETILNINERTCPGRASGRFALCLEGSDPLIPRNASRVDLPCRTSRAVVRIDPGESDEEAARLQQQFTLAVSGQGAEPEPVILPHFSNTSLPGAELFERASDIIASEPDINAGMNDVRTKLAAASALVDAGPRWRERIDASVRQAWSLLAKLCHAPGPRVNGWSAPSVVGNYGSNFRARTMMNLTALWANQRPETGCFVSAGLDGSRIYAQTFPPEALPAAKARYQWSVTAVDAITGKVVPNALERFLLGTRSPLAFDDDGSLTLLYSPDPPDDNPPSNWLPTPADGLYNLMFRFYGPSPDVSECRYFPPVLIPRG